MTGAGSARVRVGAALGAAIMLVGVVGAPVVPVVLGAGLAYGWLLWRAVATR
jgi:hypothetical protein